LQLEVDRIGQPQFQRGVDDGPLVGSRPAAVGVAEHRKIGFVLKMAGVDRVRAVGLRRPISAEAAQLRVGRRIEQRVDSLVGGRIVGDCRRPDGQ